MLPLLDPAEYSSQSLRLSFSYEELAETDLPNMIHNMKLVIAGQTEEIECLRMTVKELVLGIAGRKEEIVAAVVTPRNLPGAIQVEESSSEDGVDQAIFRRTLKITASREYDDDGYSHLLSSIVRSRSNLTEGSQHMEPEGTYTPQKATESMFEQRKKDPPTLGEQVIYSAKSVSWDDDTDDDGYNDDHGRENYMVTLIQDEGDHGAFVESTRFRQELDSGPVIVGHFDPREAPLETVAASSIDEDIDTLPIKSGSPVASPARERAKNIVQERRRRYQHFRSKTGNGGQSGSALRSKLSKTSGRLYTEDGMSRGTSSMGTIASTSSMPISPLVRFREDELTLLETKKNKEPKEEASNAI